MADQMPPEYDAVDPLTLDANAVAGMLQDAFGVDMTGVASRCDHCANRAQVGSLRAYVGGPGVVLRCSVCSGIVIRVMRRSDGSFLIDARGAAYLRM